MGHLDLLTGRIVNPNSSLLWRWYACRTLDCSILLGATRPCLQIVSPDPDAIGVIGKKPMMLESVNGHRSKFQYSRLQTHRSSWLRMILIKRSKTRTWFPQFPNCFFPGNRQNFSLRLLCGFGWGTVSAASAAMDIVDPNQNAELDQIELDQLDVFCP